MPKGKKHSPQTIERAQKLYYQGKENIEIAKLLDIHINTIKSWINKFGWSIEKNKAEKSANRQALKKYQNDILKNISKDIIVIKLYRKLFYNTMISGALKVSAGEFCAMSNQLYSLLDRKKEEEKPKEKIELDIKRLNREIQDPVLLEYIEQWEELQGDIEARHLELDKKESQNERV